MHGQTYSFKSYGVESNIPNGFVYTLNQSNDGFLWVGTGSGLSRFDGFTFFPVQFPDSLGGRYPTATLKDKSGKLWFGFSDGSVFYSEGSKLTGVPLPNSKIIKDLVEKPDGSILIIPQEQPVYAVNPVYPESVTQYSFKENPVMISASLTESGGLLIGTQENILLCRLEKDSVFVDEVIEGFDFYGISSIHQTRNSSLLIIGTEGNGIFKLKMSEKGNQVSRFVDHPELEILNIQAITEDSENDLWISTFGDGAIQVSFSDDFESVRSVRNYDINSGLEANNVKSVFQDVQGNYWIGFFGEGISMLTSYALSYYTPGKNSLENNIIFVGGKSEKIILGTPSGFHTFDPEIGKSLSFNDLSREVGQTDITSYFIDNEETLWIGTGGRGLYFRNKGGAVSLFYRSGDSGSDNILDIQADDSNIWLSTANGLIVLERKSRMRKQIFDINTGLPHNYINKIFLNKDGESFVGIKSDRLYKIDKDFNVSRSSLIMYGGLINEILSLTQSKDGVVWAATRGNGIFKCIGDSATAINRSNDLLSNFCYSILSDSENNIWIGHEKGFSRFNPGTGIMRIYGTEFARIGVCNPGGMFESADNKVFIGTTDGLIVFDKAKEKKREVAPFNNITSITINDVVYDYQSSFSLPYNKKYLIKINYSGIDFQSPDKVYYSTYLENYDSDWSKLGTSTEVSYSLSYGKYKFNLLSVNDDGLSSDTNVSFRISISKPFWMKWWFVIMFFSVLTGVVILIIREREKAHKKIQEYLETELEARTSVVMKQKAEIELQNIEITDSINYAKRIQTSILPDVARLKESFTDAFILFKPRDIVSGDFYWFDKIEDDKFILVCADSTGHGVPGAFMSMIGSTLLQDIVTRQKISKPSEILTLLDKQIFSTLNQNDELGVANDGMDVVVCELNVKTRHIRFSSAMRPVIIVLENDSYYIKGNRSSVGGESVMEKYFDDQEYYLGEGDTIYLFSDGISDQFGGPDGKKMKIARLKTLLEQVSKLPMEEQKAAIINYYDEWRGSYEQVDDILLMGVKV